MPLFDTLPYLHSLQLSETWGMSGAIENPIIEDVAMEPRSSYPIHIFSPFRAPQLAHLLLLSSGLCY